MTDRITLGDEPWSAIPRRVLRDPKLTPRAKGGLVTLLSHDEGWVRSCIGTLRKECDCGRTQAKTIMAELVAAGYATVQQKRGSGGRFTTGYEVSATSTPPNGRSRGTRERGPGARGPVTRATVVDPPEVDPKEVDPQKKKQPRPRDEAFEALCEVAELTDWREVTPKVRDQVNTALADIRAQWTPIDLSRRPDGELADQIRLRAGYYRSHFSGATISALALAKYWPRLARPAPDSSGNVDVDEVRRRFGVAE